MKEPKTPMGTVAVMTVFFVLLVALWANVYFTVLSRGVTQ